MSETVTQLLDRYDDDLMELARLSTQGMFDKDLYASASETRQQIVDLVAAARREVETAQAESRLRGETIDALRKEVAGWEERTKHLGSVVLRAWEVLRKWWQWSKLEDRDEPFADALARAIAEDASHDAYALSEMRRLNEEAERQAGVICNLNTDLAASRAALEDVRRVEKWLAKDFQLGRYVKTTGSGKLVAIEEDPDMAVVAISLEALGRALAQEAGDAK